MLKSPQRSQGPRFVSLEELIQELNFLIIVLWPINHRDPPGTSDPTGVSFADRE
jgi:hypothetical protein